MQTAEQKIIDGLSMLCKTGQDLSSARDVDELLEKIMKSVKEICDCDASSILLMDEATNELYFKVALGSKGEQVRRLRFPADQGIAGWVATNRQPLIVNDVKSDPRHLMRIDVQSTYETKSIACVPVMWENKVIGVIQALNKHNNQLFTDDDIRYLTILANQSSIAINNARNMENQQNFFVNIMEILVQAIEAQNPLYEGHSIRIARIATSIAREMGITGKEYENIYYASLIHDIGKLKLYNASLEESYRMYPVLGAEMIRPIKILEDVAPIIEAHHERWDGSGFPNGLKGEEIPLGARIVGIAEAYEEWALEMREQQKENFGLYDFLNQSPGAFDPKAVQVLVRLKDTLGI